MAKKAAGRPSRPDAERIQAVKESFVAGNTVKAVAAKFGVSANTLQNWRKAYPQAGAQSSTLATGAIRSMRNSRNVAARGMDTALRQENAQLRAQNKAFRDIIIEQELQLRGFSGRQLTMPTHVAAANLNNGTVRTN